MSATTEVPHCPGCSRPIDACSCTCPFCGQSEECTCAVGYGTATGG